MNKEREIVNRIITASLCHTNFTKDTKRRKKSIRRKLIYDDTNWYKSLAESNSIVRTADMKKQESPPAWTQEAYRPPCSKYSLCCPNWVPPRPDLAGGVPWLGTPPGRVPLRQGTPWVGYPSPAGYPPAGLPPGRVSPGRVPPAGYPLGRVPPNRVPPGRVPPRQGTPQAGYPSLAGYPPSRVTPLAGYPPAGYPSRVPPGQGTPQQGTPWQGTPQAGLPPPAGPGRVPPGCPMAFWVMLQSIMGYGYPPCRQTDRHVSKHYLPIVLRTRAVNIYLYLYPAQTLDDEPFKIRRHLCVKLWILYLQQS